MSKLRKSTVLRPSGRRLIRNLLSLVAWGLLGVPAAWAVGGGETTSSATPPTWLTESPSSPIIGGDQSLSFDYWGYLFNIGFLLILVLGLAFIAVRLNHSKLLPRLGLRGNDDRQIRVVERLLLEPKKHLYLVSIGHQTWLIGSSEMGLQHIANVDASASEEAPEVVAKLSKVENQKSFSNYLPPES